VITLDHDGNDDVHDSDSDSDGDGDDDDDNSNDVQDG
jgi:hypothetical protein